MNRQVSILLLIFLQSTIFAQSPYTRADTLRGMLTPARSCYDVTFYDLHLEIDVESRTIKGYNDIHFEPVHASDYLQIDLFENMSITGITRDNAPVPFKRDGNAVFVETPITSGSGTSRLRISYEGKPTTAQKPPWDGGFVWSNDKAGKPFIGVACEGIGASIWWPNKDHLSDEPDSMRIGITVPENLYVVSNGVLLEDTPLGNGKRRFTWKVNYPINNYNVTVNIADYAHFSDWYVASDGDSLPLDYYVLKENLEKARKHFSQVKPVLEAYEHYFGKYPFWIDGFCLVETPYLGMEHQGAIAYGNGYKPGYFGSKLLHDMDWDYIIVHETAHEYWGNAVSVSDHAEMWLHESFATYMEVLFVEYHWGEAKSIEYLEAFKPFVRNQEPIIGPLDVNYDGFSSSDHYMKGAWVLHTLRHSLSNDDLFFKIMRTFYETHKFKVTNTESFIRHVNRMTGKDYTPFFEQYLYSSAIPVLEYVTRIKGKDIELLYRWHSYTRAEFRLPVEVRWCKDGTEMLIPTGKWQKLPIGKCKSSQLEFGSDLGLFQVRELHPGKLPLE